MWLILIIFTVLLSWESSTKRNQKEIKKMQQEIEILKAKVAK